MNDDPKQVKEKVRYFKESNGMVWRKSGLGTAFCSGKNSWLFRTFYDIERLEELTEAEAAAIIGRKNVYGKEGDEKCAAPVTMESKQPEQSAPSITAASQAAKVTNAAQFEPKAIEPDAKGVQPTQAEQDEKLCEELRVAFHTATEMGLPFSASALDTAIKRIRELSNGPVEMAHCDKCGLGTNKWHTLCDFCLDASIDEKPQWLSVSQCDLKPGEAFWYIEYGEIIVKEEGLQNAKNFFQSYPHITHYLRALPPYAIPKPPVKVEDDDGFEKWLKSEYGDCECLTKEGIGLLKEGWNARASITEKGGDDLSKAIYTYKHMCPRWTEERLNDFILGYEAARASLRSKGGDGK